VYRTEEGWGKEKLDWVNLGKGGGESRDPSKSWENEKMRQVAEEKSLEKDCQSDCRTSTQTTGRRKGGKKAGAKNKEQRGPIGIKTVPPPAATPVFPEHQEAGKKDHDGDNKTHAEGWPQKIARGPGTL